MSGLGTTAIAERGDVTVVALAGAIDVYNVWEIESAFEQVDPVERQVVIDLSRVTLVDSSGMRALVRLRGRADEGDRMVGIVCPRLDLRRIIEVVGLADGFLIADDLRTLRPLLQQHRPAGRAMAPVA